MLSILQNLVCSKTLFTLFFAYKIYGKCLEYLSKEPADMLI